MLPIDSRIYKNLKSQWGEFGLWVAKQYGVNNMQIENSMVEVRVFSETKAQKDNDNIAGGHKLFSDGAFVDSKMFVDDCYLHINPFLIVCEYDKENPRYEIRITIIDNEITDVYEKMKLHLATWEK